MNQPIAIYEMQSTSRNSGNFSPIVLWQTDQIRLLLKPEYARKNETDEPSLRFTFYKQRKSKKDAWENVPEPSPNLTAGELRKLELDSQTTAAFLNHSDELKALLKEKGFQFGEKRFVVGQEGLVYFSDSAQQARVIKHLVSNVPSEVLKELAEVESEEADKFAYLKLATKRKKSLQEFDRLFKEDVTELVWQRFFERNTWIFGYGLKYQFLQTLQPQAYVGGKNIKNQKGQVTDFMCGTSAESARFTVLVEIKRVGTPLLEKTEIRNGTYAPNKDLSEAVAQVLSNARTWETEGALSPDSIRQEAQNLYTVQPRAILIVGNTSSLVNNVQKTAFELYRRNLRSPEIVTFDELRQRAGFLVKTDEGKAG